MERKTIALLFFAMFVSVSVVDFAYAGDMGVGVSGSASVVVERASLFYVKNLVFPVAFPALYGVSVFSSNRRNKTKMDFLKKLEKGWMLFGVFAFVTTTASVFGLFADAFSIAYIGAYFVSVVLFVATLGYVIVKRVRIPNIRKDKIETRINKIEEPI